jgi:uncharacterized membrane protein YvlD (DUF360 family)
MDYKSIFKSWLLVALGVLIASHMFTGIRYTDTSALIVAVLLLSLCNVFLKPATHDLCAALHHSDLWHRNLDDQCAVVYACR